MAGSLSEELLAIRLELKGVRETVKGFEDTAKAQKDATGATAKLGSESEKTSKKTGVLSKAFGALGKAARYGIGFLGVGAVFALHSAVEKTEELAKTTSMLSRNLSFNTNVASRWGAVAQAREIDSKSLGMSFTTLSKKLTEAARKGGAALLPFNQLGISQEQVAKGAKNFQEGIMTVGKALGEAKGGPERQAAAVGLLGKGWSTVLPLFAEGTESLKEQLHWADEFGVTLSGKTNEGLMDMVNAQRKNKVAMLGLQITMTKALMPAIKLGDDQLQEFIKTLNDPKLSGEQKLARIEHQFLQLENYLFKLLEQALPHIAEQGGMLGLKLAGALWHGFIHSSILGKLVIAAWVFNAMGGFGAIASAGAWIGRKLAVSLGTRFIETVAPYFAAEAGVEGLGAAVASQMTGLRTLFAGFGETLGTAMGLAAGAALVGEIVFAVKDSENIAGLSLINTPKTGSTSIEDESKYLSGLGYTGIGFNNGHELIATSPSGKHVTYVEHGDKWVQKGAHSKRRPAVPHSSPRPRKDLGLFRDSASRGDGGDRHIHLYMDGREIAKGVVREAENEAALR